MTAQTSLQTTPSAREIVMNPTRRSQLSISDLLSAHPWRGYCCPLRMAWALPMGMGAAPPAAATDSPKPSFADGRARELSVFATRGDAATRQVESVVVGNALVTRDAIERGVARARSLFDAMPHPQARGRQMLIRASRAVFRPVQPGQ
jgi:hypothetical protein